ncbi:LpqN/LpqT family lipoprotein [Nocardioides nitrophenolicus]|uniref:LpqN/LpqT family lipoprotein n=1 Tax=Nocardioides nitrophenolicus TaxID=60489 RepID=UPI0019575E50|nr:LpqN/LpqT family lipoprotein [Nocardioides nitrophenolicus]MBM7517249.1 hypothetical protein [Nocardioides nitrophenolicus]
MTHPARLLVGPAALMLALSLAACGQDSADEGAAGSKDSPSATPTSAPPAPTASSSQPTATEPTSIPDYLDQEGIEQTLLTRDDTDGLTLDLPVPDGWSSTDAFADAAPFGAIALDAAAEPANPPRILAILARLDGDADPAKILAYAPSELQSLPGFTPLSMGDPSTLSGFDAVQVGGTYTEDDQELVIAQKTVAISSARGLYVLQLNAYAPSAEVDALIAAMAVIDEQTTITAP